MGYQIILTFILLIFLIFLQDWMSAVYKLMLIAVLSIGFSFSWLSRRYSEAKIRSVITTASLFTVVWLVYSLLTGSLLYKEIIVKCLKAVWILIVIFSFHARPYILHYIQLLSIVVFLSHCLFVTDYKPIPILGYLTLWVFILRCEFLRLFFEKGLSNFIKQRSLFISIGLFLVILISAFSLTYRLKAKNFKKGGMFFWEEKLEADQEKEYYILQKDFQNKTLNLIPTLDNQEQRYEVIGIVGSFIKETPYMTELDSAEERLAQSFTLTKKTAFQQERKEVILSAKTLLDKKLLFALDRENETISNILKRYPFNIKERIDFSFSLNKIYSTSDYHQIKNYLKGLLDNIEHSTLESKAKRELKESLYRLYGLKLFSIYHKQIEPLIEDVSKTKDKKDFLDLISKMRRIEDYRGLKEIKKELQEVKGIGSEELFERVKDLLEIKEEILNYELLRKLNERIEESNISEYERESLKDKLDEIFGQEEYKKLKEKLERIPALIPDNLQLKKEDLDNLLGFIVERLLEKDRKEIERLLDTSILNVEQKEGFFKKIEKMKEAEDMEELNDRFIQIINKLKEFLNQGFISSDTGEKISDRLEELKSIFEDRIRKTEKAPYYYQRKKYKDIIKKLPLDNEKKSQLMEIIERLSVAENILEIEKLAELFRKELNNLSKELSQEELKRIREEFEDFFEFRKAVIKDKSISEKEMVQDKKILFIKIIPDYLEVALGREIKFNAEGVFTDGSTLDLTYIGNWLSSNPYVAEVFQGKGKAYSQGQTQIYLEYEGLKSQPATLIIKPKELISIVVSPKSSKIFMGDNGFLKATGYFTDSSSEDITSLVSWEVDKKIISIKNGKIYPRWLGKTDVWAYLNGIRSLPVEVMVVFSWRWFSLMTLKTFLFLIIIMLAIFAILYLIVQKRKKKILSLLSHPQRFIVSLYQNLENILKVFGFGRKDFMPPLYYAQILDKKYALKDNLFLKMAMKFEEAKYSQHILKDEDTQIFLNNYNEFLNRIKLSYNKFVFFIRYWLILIKRLPFHI